MAFRFRDDQMEPFRQKAIADFETEMVLHSKDFSPKLSEVLGDDQLRVAVRQAIGRAKGHGFTQRGPIRLYVELMFLFGSDFDTDPQYPAIREVLETEDDQMKKANRICERVVEYNDKVAGGNNIHVRSSGSGFYVKFSPGGKFKINKHSRPSENGKSYVLTEVYTELNSNLGFGHDDVVDFRNEFRCIPAETTFRPFRHAKKPVVEGPQTAIVTTDGQEIVVDEHARVKVQFHWDRYGKKDINSSCWIRVSQHHSGAGGPTWGMIDIPRRNEEVIVDFLDGDPDRPIITGRVYNGDNLSPYPLKGAGNNSKHKKRRGNITKSYEAEGYNEFSMDDTEGEEQVRLHAQYDMDQHVRNDSREHVVKNRHLIVDVDQNELVGQDKDLNVKRHQYEHIEGDMMLTIGEGDADGGHLDVIVEKKMTEKIGPDGYEFHLEGDRKVLIDRSDSLAVGGDQMRAIGGDRSLKIKGDHNQKIDGSNSLDIGMSHEQKVGMKHAVDAGMEVHLKAGMKVIIEAGVQISLVGPGGFVDIGPAGVTIQGIMVKINSGGAAGSGSGASPKKPKDPAKPKDAKKAGPTKPDEADVYRP